MLVERSTTITGPMFAAVRCGATACISSTSGRRAPVASCCASAAVNVDCSTARPTFPSRITGPAAVAPTTAAGRAGTVVPMREPGDVFRDGVFGVVDVQSDATVSARRERGAQGNLDVGFRAELLRRDGQHLAAVDDCDRPVERMPRSAGAPGRVTGRRGAHRRRGRPARSSGAAPRPGPRCRRCPLRTAKRRRFCTTGYGF